MKITIVFPKNGLVTARFEGEIYAYTRAYADMRTLANDYINILFNDMDGSELAGWSYNDPQVWGTFSKTAIATTRKTPRTTPREA